MHYVDSRPSPDCLATFKNDPMHTNDHGEYLWNLSPEEHFELVRELVRQFPGVDRGAGVCAYCEKQCDDRGSKYSQNREEIEHFRPRRYFNSLTFAWSNLMLTCRQCNKQKLEQFPGQTSDWSAAESEAEANKLGKSYVSPSEQEGYVNPRENGADQYFVFDASGRIKANPDLPDSEWSRANRTINDLDLNHLDVNQNRDYCQRRTFQLFMAYCSIRQLGERRSRFTARRMPYSSFIIWADSQGYFELDPTDLPEELRNGFREIVEDI